LVNLFELYDNARTCQRQIYYSKSAVHVSGHVFAQLAVSTHRRHQPAASWVNTTRYCKYSQVLLTMGENIARNM